MISRPMRGLKGCVCIKHVCDWIACLYTRWVRISTALNRRLAGGQLPSAVLQYSRMCFRLPGAVDHSTLMINLQIEVPCFMNWWILLSHKCSRGPRCLLCSQRSPWHTDAWHVHVRTYNNYDKSYDSLTRSGTSPSDRLVLSGQAGTKHVTTNGGTVYVVTTAPVFLATRGGSVVATFAITNTGVLGSKVSPNLQERSSEREGTRHTR
jgi:hypothetical protein